MTRERARELLPVIQAFAEGKQIQFECGGRFEDLTINHIDLTEHRQYRIKPEPREWWILSSEGWYHGVYSSKEPAIKEGQYRGKPFEVFHVREVLSEIAASKT